MELLIIQPSYYSSKSNLNVYKAKKRPLIGLTLPYLGALAPKQWKVTLIDEQITDIDFNKPVDMVAITTWTINSLRAYDISAKFRKRGIPVIMGGPHTFFYHNEAMEHCDAIGIGEGEEILPIMLADAAKGELKKVYRAKQYQDLINLPLPRYDLLKSNFNGFFKTYSIQTSRGCPFSCDFCSERHFLGKKYRYRPVENVIEEIKASGGKNIFFADSNFAGNLNHTMELMEAIIPLKIKWSTLWSAYLCNNKEFMDLAKKSGLLHVNIGIESIDSKTLGDMNKKANKVQEYKEMIENLRNRGISHSLNFIFGWDTETKSIFESTLQFLKENKVHAAYFNILNPYKGTSLYNRLKEEERITDDYNLGRWPGMFCHIKPKYCTAQELMNHVQKTYINFYNFPSMFYRLPLPVTKSNIASWIINLSQRKIALNSKTMDTFGAI